MKLVPFEAADSTDTVWINPEHIILVAAVREKGVPMLGRSVLKMFDGVFGVKGSPEEIAEKINA